jgi:hypothetical protein
VVAAIGFAGSLVLARVAHPGTTAAPSGSAPATSSSTTSVVDDEGDFFGDSGISGTSGSSTPAPDVQTSVS